MSKLLVLFLAAGCALAQPVPNVSFLSCPNTPNGQQPYQKANPTGGHLRRVVLDGPNSLCNDGTKAEMYVREARAGATEPDGPSANRWVIHLLGGSSCSEYEECAARWCGIGAWEGTLMTTKFSGDFRNADGLLGRNNINRIGDRNEVLMKYCSSDNGQGRKSDVVIRSEIDPSRALSLHFRGADIFDNAMDMLERGVPGMPKLTDATDVLLSGDSAGAQGARAHLDRLNDRLKAKNSNVRVKGNFEATFNPDLNGKQGFPAGDPRDPVYPSKTAEFSRLHVELRNSVIDASCEAAHPNAKYLCADQGYLTLNHITTPFFQAMDLHDPLAVNGYLSNGLNTTPAGFAQGVFDQMNLLAGIRNTAIDRNQMTQAPGVGGRNCSLHVTWGNDDGFLGPKYRAGTGAPEFSYYQLLWNWLTGAAPTVVVAPRPPDTPTTPIPDPICTTKAPNSPAVSIATASSASYDFEGPVAPESIVTTFGTNLAGTTALATAIPYPTNLGGVTITVTDANNSARLAPVYFVSPTQVSYLIPAGTVPGTARIQIGSQTSTVQVATTAPAIYTANSRGTGVAAATYLRVTPSGTRTEGLLFDANTKDDTGIPAAAGDQIYIILYGTGLRGGSATATLSDAQVPLQGPVAHSQFPGLDQINIGPLPVRAASIPSGYGPRQLIVRQGSAISNAVNVTFRAP